MPLQEISEAELLAPKQATPTLQEIPESELLGASPHKDLVEAKELLPIEDLHAEIDRGEFSPLDYSAKLNTTGDFDKLSADQQNKLIDAYKYQSARGVTTGAIGRAVKEAPTVAKNILAGAGGVIKRVADVASDWGRSVAGQETNDKSIAELGSAVESGGLNTLEFGRDALRKITGPSVKELTPEEIKSRFFSDLGLATQRAKAAQGQGALAEATGHDAETLKRQGIELDPEAISDMSLIADPTNYVPALGGFKILSKLGKQIGFVRGVAKVEEAVNKVSQGLATTAGKAAALPGRAVEKVGEIAKSRAAQMGALAAGSGLTAAASSGDPENILKAAAGTLLAPIVLKHGGELLEKVGKATANKAGTLAERAADFTLNHAVKPAVQGAVVGGTMAVPLAMLAENDDAASSIISGGLAFGAVGHTVHQGAKDAGQVLGNHLAEQYQTLSQRPKVESPGYGNPMDEVHNAAINELAAERPADANVINTVREAFRDVTLPDGRKINAEVYLVPEDVKPPELSDAQFNAARPAGFWSGITPEGKARIYLFKDATAVFHEPGHLIHNLVKLADPATSTALEHQVNASFPAPAREAFRQAYEKRLYGDVENRPRMTDEQVTNEIVAESFSNMLRGHSLDGLPAPFRQRIATTLGGFLESSGLYQPGVKPAGTGTTGPLQVAPGGFSPLGIGHSFNLTKLGSDFLSRLGVRVPEESAVGPAVETPVQPAPKKATLSSVPVEPKKVSAEQKKEDQQLKNQPPLMTLEPGVDAKWNEAEALVKDPAELETLRSLRAAVDKPQGEVGPVRSPYFSVIENSGQSPVERSARRMQQNIAAVREELGAVPEDLREMVFKTHIPNRVIIRQHKDGSPNINVVGTSVEKIFVNATLAAREAAKAGVSIPIETKNGKITPNGFRQLFDAVTKYTQNHMNGYAGDGSKVAAPANYESDIPPVNTSYTPKPLEARTSQFVNLLQGIEPPRTTSRMDRAKRFNKAGEELTVPRNIEATSLARENNRPVLEAVNVRSVEGKRPVFRETGETIKELNPLRDEFAQKGVDLSKILHESVEELNLEHFGGAIEPVQSSLRGVSTPLATAGFMPKEGAFMPKPGEHTEIINQMDQVPGEKLKTLTDKAEGGLTGLAYDIGLTVRDPQGLQRLKDFQEKWQKEARRFLDEGNLKEALPAVMKSQFFREAYEAATNSGSAAGPNGFKALRPGVKAPFEELPSVVKQKAGFMPDPKPAKREVNPELEGVARKYAERNGITYQPRNDYVPVNENRAKELADWYESAPHDPENPEVQQSYKAFIDETMNQYKDLADAGYKIEPWVADKGEPYKNSAEAVADIRDNKHLWFFPTEKGFGTSDAPKDHPLLADSGVKINGKSLVYNDVFRAVHDLFGHGLKGNQFGPRGELNAWRDHSELYSDAAKPAMSAETLAQNSWVNFGRHLRDASGKIPGKGEKSFVPLAERPFAEQKATVLPAEFSEPAKAPGHEMADAFKEAIAPLVEALRPRERGLKSFMPNPDKPEAIKEAAVKIRGRVFTGFNHADAIEMAHEHGISRDENFLDGFVTNSGEFLTRDQAFRRAQDMDQIPKIRPHNSFADLGMLESNEFEQHRAFMPALKDNLLDEIKKGTRDGATLNKDGSEFTPGDRKLDVVTVASVDIPASDLSQETLKRVLEPFAAIIDKPEVKPGVFRIARKGENGEDLISVDVNALVDQKHRDNTAKFASDNNQESFFDLANLETVSSGGDGRTVLKSPSDIARAVDLLVRGEPVDVYGIQKGAFMPKREQKPLGLSDVEVKPVYDREEMKTLTRSGLRERFPEAVVPRSENDLVDYNIDKSPRYKQAKTEEAAVKDFSDQLEAKYKEHENDPRVQQGRTWYSDFIPAVREMFGDKSPEFVELLAATSPRNTPKKNFAYAIEAFDIWQRGGYDKLIAKFQEGLDKLGNGSLEKDYLDAVPERDRPDKPKPATFLAWWIEKNDLIPKRDNGKLFGMNSTAVLKVVTRQWMSESTGLKTRQFVQNLLGTDHGATIDMWAARTMREIGYKGYADRWRILSENEAPVRDPDFKFSQKVFAETARRLKMQPDELQAAMWFLEKKLWNDNGWNKADYGSFQEPLRDLQVRRAGPRQEAMNFEVKPKP